MKRNPNMTGLEALAAIQRRDDAQHDHAVANFGPGLLAAIWADLNARMVHDRKNPEHRWIMNRRAAVARRAMRMERSMA